MNTFILMILNCKNIQGKMNDSSLECWSSCFWEYRKEVVDNRDRSWNKNHRYFMFGNTLTWKKSNLDNLPVIIFIKMTYLKCLIVDFGIDNLFLIDWFLFFWTWFLKNDHLFFQVTCDVDCLKIFLSFLYSSALDKLLIDSIWFIFSYIFFIFRFSSESYTIWNNCNEKFSYANTKIHNQQRTNKPIHIQFENLSSSKHLSQAI